jgi:hypothetical protein
MCIDQMKAGLNYESDILDAWWNHFACSYVLMFTSLYIYFIGHCIHTPLLRAQELLLRLKMRERSLIALCNLNTERNTHNWAMMHPTAKANITPVSHMHTATHARVLLTRMQFIYIYIYMYE